MNISKWIIGTALVLSAPVTYAQADTSCEPCSPCAVSNPCDLCDINFCDMKFCAYVDALYWQVDRSGLDYGGGDHHHFINPDYQWGWRIAGIASWRSWDFGLRYTSFNTDHNRHEGHHKGHYNFDFQVLDIEAGYTCCLPCGGLTLRPFAGAKLAWIEEHFKHHHEGSDHHHARLDDRGVGLYLGLCGRWEICQYTACERTIPIALVTRASAAVMHNEFKKHDKHHNDSRHFHEENLYTPVYELYAGLDFTFCDLWCGWDAFFQVGYEVQYWGWRGFPSYHDGDHNAWDDNVAHLGLGGLVLRFGASF